MVIVCYDVETTNAAGARRLRRIAEVCKDYGVRVQYSVFECDVADRDWVTLRHRLLAEFDVALDSLRFYFLNIGEAAQTEHHGVRRPINIKGPLVI